jgi:hypothetical protein
LKPSGLREDPLEEPGGVGLGPVHAAGKAGTETIERAVIDAHEPGVASLDANTAPVPTEGTASVELFGVAKNAATAEPEALEPRAEGEAWRRLEKPPLPPSQKDPGVLGTPPREALNKGMRRRGLEAPPPPRESPSEGERGPQQAPRETPRAGVLALQESVSAVLKGSTPGHFEESPPWDIEGEPGGANNFDLKRPFEAREATPRAILAITKMNLAASKFESVQRHH